MEIEIIGLNKAVDDYKGAIMADNDLSCACLMLNRDTGEIWTDIFTSINKSFEYKEPSIVNLIEWIALKTNDDFEIDIGFIKSCAERCCEEYQEKDF